MKAKILIEYDHMAASVRAAEILTDALKADPEMIVTFAAGATPLECYRLLAELQREGKTELRRATYVGLDEWIGLGPEDAGSCIETMNTAYYIPAGIPWERIVYFDGRCRDPEAEARRVSGQIRELGGIDLAVLGVGVNGHIGFNEPDVSLRGEFSLVSLSKTTQTVGRKYFNGGQTPQKGATITLETLKQAKTVIVIATGENKRQAATHILAEDGTLPAGAFLNHPNAWYIFDKLAVPDRC